MSTSPHTLQEEDSIDEFFDVVATETLALFEHLAFEFLSECYDPTAEEHYYGSGYTIVSTGSKIPIAAEFTESKQASEETASSRRIRVGAEHG